jgi:hypothetical protein
MHKYLESFITDVGYDDLTELGQAAKPMAEKIMEVGLAPVDEYFGSEVTLHYPGLYAGQTDLVCLHNGIETVVDFKQANRPKKKGMDRRLLSYKLQPMPWPMITSTRSKITAGSYHGMHA